MANVISLPIIDIDGELWIRVNFTKSIKMRADGIEKKKKRVKDRNDHRMDEAIAKGSVKFTSNKSWDLTEFLKITQ